MAPSTSGSATSKPLKAASSIDYPEGIFEWEFGHVFAAIDLGNSIALNIHLYGVHSATVELSDDPRVWKGRIFDGGTEPYTLASYVATRLRKNDSRNAELREFLAEMSRTPQRPLPHLNGPIGVMAIAGQYYAVVCERGERREIGPFDEQARAEAVLATAMSSRRS